MAVPGAADYEMERMQRIANNRKMMEDMGLFKQKTILDSFKVVKKPEAPVFKPYVRKERAAALRAAPRRSKRLTGERVDYFEIDDDDRPVVRATGADASDALLPGLDEPAELVDLLDRRAYRAAPPSQPPEPSAEALEAIQAARCASQGRGSVYDSTAGITCHFCRQKKLCGEEGCGRCSERDINKECIGKTECTKCGGATGRFCRACLLIRYGQTLEEARAQMAGGCWLCPHCYEEEHPDDGWICNSSICMKRRGLKPTGIAIYDAHERGFKSVAHLLQAELRKRPGVLKGEAEAEQGSQQDAAAAPGAEAQQGEGVQGPGGGSSSSSSQEPAQAAVTMDADAAAAAVEEGASQLGRGARRGRGRPPKAPAQAAVEGGVAKGGAEGRARRAVAQAAAEAAVAQAEAEAGGSEQQPATRRSTRSNRSSQQC